MNINLSENTYERLPFISSLSISMIERLGLRRMIDDESFRGSVRDAVTSA